MRTAPATGRHIAMVSVKTLRGFRNTDEDGNREYVGPNRTLEVSEQRAKDLEANGLIERTSASGKKAAGTPANKSRSKAANKSTDTDPADTGTSNAGDSAGSEGGTDSGSSGE